jgi:transcription antitermination factor NusG
MQMGQEGGLWHAVHTKHQHEKTVVHLLEAKGFETFLPLYVADHRWRDRTKRVSLPLFPCYVFLRGGLDRRLQVLKTPGVHGIVETAGRPGVIPDGEIVAIRRVLESSLPIEPFPFLQCGDRVRIISGPLAELEGVLVRKRDQLRLVLSVEMLRRSVAVEVAVMDVEPVSKAADRSVVGKPVLVPSATPGGVLHAR